MPKKSALKLQDYKYRSHPLFTDEYQTLVGGRSGCRQVSGTKTRPSSIRVKVRVIKTYGKTIAVCHDSDGTLHEHSAVCPHLGCIVARNASEHTWDCPCHGSRFMADGSVIAGPAEESLRALEDHKTALPR